MHRGKQAGFPPAAPSGFFPRYPARGGFYGSDTGHVNVLPTAGFSSSVNGLTVTFTDSSTDSDGTIAAWDWNWGDGTTHGTTQNPNHTYAAAGTYSVTLTVTDNNGGTGQVSHNVVPNALPTAAFTSSVNGYTVTFTDASTDSDGSIASWDWDFGDGTSHSTSQNPTHTYATAGSFTVVLTVTDNVGGTGNVSHSVTTVAVTPVTLTSGSSTTDAASYNTASVTLTANRAYYLGVFHTRNPLSNNPTISSTGATWVSITSDVISTFRKWTVFRTMVASNQTGAITIDFAAQNQDVCGWILVECPNVDTSGTNASGATVQSAHQSNATGTGTTITLAALGNSNNVHLAFVGQRTATSNVTAGANFAELTEVNVANTTIGGTIEVQWAKGQVSCSPTWASDTSVQISIEVKAG